MADCAYAGRSLTLGGVDKATPRPSPVRTSAYGRVILGVWWTVPPPRLTPGRAMSDGRLLGFIGDTEGLLEIEEFREGLLAAVHRAVATDWVSLNDIGPDPGRSGDGQAAPDHHRGRAAGVRALRLPEPADPAFAQTHDGRTLRLSDVIDADTFRTREIYTEYYAVVGVEYQMGITLPHDRDRILGVALSRTHTDFSDADRDLLERARPFLIQAYRNAVRFTELLDRQTTPRNQARLPECRRLADLGLTSRRAKCSGSWRRASGDREIATRLQISHRTIPDPRALLPPAQRHRPSSRHGDRLVDRRHDTVTPDLDRALLELRRAPPGHDLRQAVADAIRKGRRALLQE